MNDSSSAPTQTKPSRKLLAMIVIAAVVLGITAVVLLVRTRQQETQPPSDLVDSSLFQPDTNPPSTEKPAQAVAAPLPPEMKDYSATNAVTILLGREGEDDGLKHLADERDGRTTIETLDGVPCRHHNRKPDNKGAGYVYFAIHPDFKRDELKTARIEVEYRVTSRTYIRLQYDGTEGDTHKRYKSAVPSGAELALGTGTRFTPIQASNEWQTATFHATDGVFMNSQNGGADFRLEVIPPEIYVRRVSVSRMAVQPAAPQTNE